MFEGPNSQILLQSEEIEWHIPRFFFCESVCLSFEFPPFANYLWHLWPVFFTWEEGGEEENKMKTHTFFLLPIAIFANVAAAVSFAHMWTLSSTHFRCRRRRLFHKQTNFFCCCHLGQRSSFLAVFAANKSLVCLFVGECSWLLRCLLPFLLYTTLLFVSPAHFLGAFFLSE